MNRKLVVFVPEESLDAVRFCRVGPDGARVDRVVVTDHPRSTERTSDAAPSEGAATGSKGATNRAARFEIRH